MDPRVTNSNPKSADRTKVISSRNKTNPFITYERYNDYSDPKAKLTLKSNNNNENMTDYCSTEEDLKGKSL